MKLGSEECNNALKNYVSKNRPEELMVELLLIPENANDDVFGNMTYKIIEELSDEEINTLDTVVTQIRDELKIED